MNWKCIKGYEGLYSISDEGTVRADAKIDRAGKLRKERMLSPSIRKDGYRRLCLVKGGKRRNYYVHRLVAEAFLSNPDNKSDVNHDDHDRGNNHVVNLTWMTHKENMEWMLEHNRHHPVSGEDHPNVNKMDSVVKNVIDLHKTGEYTQTKLSKIFGIPVSTINYWVNGKYRRV